MNRKRILAAVLAAVLAAACMANAGASGIRELIRFAGSGEPVGYEFTAAFEKLPQFDGNRTDQLNRLLRHFVFSGVLDSRETTLSVCLDGESLFTVSETEVGGKTTRMLACDPDTNIIIPGEKTDTDPIVSVEGYRSVSENLCIYTVLEEYTLFFRQLPDLYPELSGSGKILEKYKDYGTAVKKTNIHFTENEWAACVRKYAPEIPEGTSIPDLRKMYFEGRQDVELLLKEDGSVLKIRYGGRAGISEDDMRTVRLEWKTVRAESVERDELSLRTLDSNAARRNNLLLEHTWRKGEAGTETFSWKTETDTVYDGIRTRGIVECTMEEADGKISGRWSETVSVKNENTVCECAFSSADEPAGGRSGILEIISTKDKIETGRMKADYRLTCTVPVQAGELLPEPKRVSDDEFDEIRGNLTRRILVKLLSLPKEDLLFLTEGIPEETVKTILPDHEQ